jgi:hypothetical protein
MSSSKKIQRIPHSAYSPEIAPNNFFLFCHIKRKLTEYDIPDRQSFKSATTHIFDEIEQKTVIGIIETRTNMLEWVREQEGEYFHQ